MRVIRRTRTPFDRWGKDIWGSFGVGQVRCFTKRHAMCGGSSGDDRNVSCSEDAVLPGTRFEVPARSRLQVANRARES